MKCPSCSSLNLVKQTTIEKTPAILCILINRLLPKELDRQRTYDEIDMPTNLTLSSEKYYLNGLLHHIGDTPKSGHYGVSIVKNSKWYYVSDANVCRIYQLNSVCELKSNYICIFFNQ